MSSKKISTTVTLDEFVMLHVREKARKERRSMTFVIEQILLDYFLNSERGEEKEVRDADKITEGKRCMSGGSL